MTQRPDRDVWGEDDARTMTDVREALERASVLHVEEPMDPDGQWGAGRRRRARSRAGAGVLAGVAAVTALAVAWQSGLMGGQTPPDPTVAAVPADYTTFVFAGPDAPDVDPDTISAVRDATPADLTGSSWTLMDQLWASDVPAADVVGGDPDVTTLRFGDGQTLPGWGFVADDCAGGWFQDDLALDDGRFRGGDMATDDQGCQDAAQASEDFWIAALGSGGYLRLLGGGDWLLVSVLAPTGSTPDPDTTPTTDPGPTAPEPTTAEPDPSSPEPTGSGEPGPDPSGTPTTDPPSEPTDDPSVTDGTPLPSWTPAVEFLTSAGWPGAGGDLLAPTVRAGRHDGFDRVVVDLTGTDAPTWRAAYQDNPVRDGSGLPAGVAGDAVLEVVLTGMAYPEPGDPVYDAGDFGLDTHTLGAVVEVIRTTPFEGQLQVFIGMQGEPRPYRILLLQDPMRLVIDVQTTP